MSLTSFVFLDEKELLDLICKEYKLNRAKASINVNYIEAVHKNAGSWAVQVQAPQETVNTISRAPHNLTVDFNPER